ncbi:hypothetical protein DO97_18740 [Neosynechococcus sphagnicola sy1]|uniref:Uncharacterized protein n=2 Tax=Neosynechococcus TaxID=1501143 RepID=A0A098TNU1_9CYAN|nr:hypothetical protein DO97_18740 [Neosynechococcus sphagnicola sy1]
MRRLANPLNYPLAVLAGMIVFAGGVRMVKLPSWLMLPVAGAIAIAGATLLKSRQPPVLELDNPALEQELYLACQQAQDLANKAETLRSEATKLLTHAAQVELLGTVQYACDRTRELPQKLQDLTRRLQGADSLLSLEDLQQQLATVQVKLETSSGVSRDHFLQLATSLQRNIDLARQGEDARQAQVVSLSTLIQDAAGTLQALQNKLRTADLSDTSQTLELRALSDQFNFVQENVDLLVSR